MKPYFLTLLLLVLYSCHSPVAEQEEKAPPPPLEVKEEAPKTYVNSRIPETLFSVSDFQLNQSITDMDLTAFEHYGEFYTEDFTIYSLNKNRIDYLAEAHFIDDINLFFIDSVLVKMQAFLREDRTNQFLSSYGRAKIYINDYRNKQLLKTEKIIQKVNGKSRINDKLDQYTLKWVRDGLDISYAVNKKVDTSAFRGKEYSDFKLASGDQYRYKLTFQTSDFDNQMAWVKWESYKESKGLKVQPSTDD